MSLSDGWVPRSTIARHTAMIRPQIPPPSAKQTQERASTKKTKSHRHTIVNCELYCVLNFCRQILTASCNCSNRDRITHTHTRTKKQTQTAKQDLAIFSASSKFGRLQQQQQHRPNGHIFIDGVIYLKKGASWHLYLSIRNPFRNGTAQQQQQKRIKPARPARPGPRISRCPVRRGKKKLKPIANLNLNHDGDDDSRRSRPQSTHLRSWRDCWRN